MARIRYIKNDSTAPINILKKEIEDEIHLCSYGCGQIAKHIVSTGKPCCENYAKKCKNYKIWFSNIIKQSYINDKTLIEKRSKLSKEVHNRPEIITKKRNTMLKLHHESCDKCKEFQDNYKNGQRRRSETMKELFNRTSEKALEFQRKHKAGVIKRSERMKERRHGDSDEAKEYRLKRTNKIRQKYITKLNKYGILKINKYSFGKLKVMYQRLNYYIRTDKIEDITTYKICR